MKLALLSLALLTGCASRRTGRASLEIDPSCITKPVIAQNCDLSIEPPKCAGPIAVNYKAGCAKIEVKK